VNKFCSMIRCGTDWNTDQYCDGKTHQLGLPQEAP